MSAGHRSMRSAQTSMRLRRGHCCWTTMSSGGKNAFSWLPAHKLWGLAALQDMSVQDQHCSSGLWHFSATACRCGLAVTCCVASWLHCCSTGIAVAKHCGQCQKQDAAPQQVCAIGQISCSPQPPADVCLMVNSVLDPDLSRQQCSLTASHCLQLWQWIDVHGQRRVCKRHVVSSLTALKCCTCLARHHRPRHTNHRSLQRMCMHVARAA